MRLNKYIYSKRFINQSFAGARAERRRQRQQCEGSFPLDSLRAKGLVSLYKDNTFSLFYQ